MKLTFSLLLLTIGLTALVALGFISNSADSRFDTISSASSQPMSGRGPVRMIRFVLLHDGVYPRQMRVDQGLLNIALEDKTDGSDGLLIESVIGDQRTKVTQVTRAERHWRGRMLVRLTPGRFIFRDDSGKPIVFSKSGERGPYETATLSDPRWSTYGYGTIRGINSGETGFYRPRN